MPLRLRGSCRCGAVGFAVDSHTPQPYQLCYCSICRKTAGGGGYAINLGALSVGMVVSGREALGVYRATIAEESGACRTSTGERNFCTRCAAALWLYDPTWPDLVHPFASAVDTPLPAPRARVHMMLGSRAEWVEPDVRPGDESFEGYPELSLDDWHRRHGAWVP